MTTTPDEMKRAILDRNGSPSARRSLPERLDEFTVYNDVALIHPSLLPLREGVIVNGGIIEGGILAGGTFNGGWFKGGNFKGGTFNGGEFRGGNFNDGNFNGGTYDDGTFNGGTFHRGCFRGGNFSGNVIVHYGYFRGGDFSRDVVVHDGTFHGGEFLGGTYYGGEFCRGKFLGGTFYDGNYTAGTYTGGRFYQPRTLIGSKGDPVNVSNYDKMEISIGCVTCTVREWLASMDVLGRLYRYTPEQIREYSDYIHLMVSHILDRQINPLPPHDELMAIMEDGDND